MLGLFQFHELAAGNYAHPYFFICRKLKLRKSGLGLFKMEFLSLGEGFGKSFLIFPPEVLQPRFISLLSENLAIVGRSSWFHQPSYSRLCFLKLKYKGLVVHPLIPEHKHF